MKNPLKGEIWFADFSGSRGHEQKKKRPAIILRDLDHVDLSIVLPCTCKEKHSNLPHTYILEPDTQNGLETKTIVLIFQITVIDKTTLIKKIGKIDEEVSEISAIIKNMLKL